MIVAHLDGGPRDDQEVALPSLVDLRVAGCSSPLWQGAFDLQATLAPTMKTGRYCVRRDFAGLPVEYSLTAYHYDWCGWD